MFLVAAIWAVTSSREATTAQFEAFPFFPDLVEQSQNLGEVVITSKENGVVRVVLSDDKTRWVAPDKHNFRVKGEEVQGLLVSLLEAEAVEAKTARADWHELLGLVDPSEGGDGVRVQLKNQSGEVFGDLIIGNNVGFGAVGSLGSRYVRRADEDQTYVARGDLAVKQELNDWIIRDVIDLFRDRVSTVSVVPADGAPYALSRQTASDENFALEAIPDGREILSEATPNQLGAALANVKFDDVRPAADFDFSKGAQITYKTFDGLQVKIAALKLAEDLWITVSVDLLPEDVSPGAENTEGAAPDPSTGLNSRDEVEAEAALLASRTNGWAFQIPSWKGDAFQRDLESMLKPLESDIDGEVSEAP